MEINTIVKKYIPEKPKVLAKEQIEVYMPTANYHTPGIATFDSNGFIVDVDGRVKLRRNSVRNVANFNINPINGICTVYYDDGTVVEFETTHNTNQLYERVGLMTMIDINPNSFVEQIVDGVPMWFAAFSSGVTGFNDDLFMVSLEEKGENTYRAGLKNEDGTYTYEDAATTRTGHFTIMDTVFKGSDGSVLICIANEEDKNKFNGRLLLLGGSIFTDTHVVTITYTPNKHMLQIFKTDGSIDVINAVTMEYVEDSIKEKLATVYHFKGAINFNELPTQEQLDTGDYDGSVWYVREEFVTDNRFKEGSYATVPAGTNVTVMYDLNSDKHVFDVLGSLIDTDTIPLIFTDGTHVNKSYEWLLDVFASDANGNAFDIETRSYLQLDSNKFNKLPVVGEKFWLNVISNDGYVFKVIAKVMRIRSFDENVSKVYWGYAGDYVPSIDNDYSDSLIVLHNPLKEDVLMDTLDLLNNRSAQNKTDIPLIARVVIQNERTYQELIDDKYKEYSVTLGPSQVNKDPNKEEFFSIVEKTIDGYICWLLCKVKNTGQYNNVIYNIVSDIVLLYSPETVNKLGEDLSALDKRLAAAEINVKDLFTKHTNIDDAVRVLQNAVNNLETETLTVNPDAYSNLSVSDIQAGKTYQLEVSMFNRTPENGEKFVVVGVDKNETLFMHIGKTGSILFQKVYVVSEITLVSNDEALKDYIDTNFLAKVTDITSTKQVYVKSQDGSQVMFPMSQDVINEALVQRRSDGTIFVPTNTALSNAAISKYQADASYVAKMTGTPDSGATRGFLYGLTENGTTPNLYKVYIQSNPNTIPLRNANGNFYVGTPTLPYEAVNKGYVDNGFVPSFPAATYISLVVRKTDGQFDSRGVGSPGYQPAGFFATYGTAGQVTTEPSTTLTVCTPAGDWDAANKQYVDDNFTGLYKHQFTLEGQQFTFYAATNEKQIIPFTAGDGTYYTLNPANIIGTPKWGGSEVLNLKNTAYGDFSFYVIEAGAIVTKAVGIEFTSTADANYTVTKL